MNTMKFYKCMHCGNVFSVLYDGGVNPVCCGEAMVEMKANTTDAANEKHVPVVEKDGNKVKVTVGSVEHPMVDEHWIVWIGLVQNGKAQFVELKPGDAPKAEFTVDDANAPMNVYEYCNLHNLWMTEA